MDDTIDECKVRIPNNHSGGERDTIRLDNSWKDKIPKGYFRAIQKSINDKLDEVSVSSNLFYGNWSGYTKDQFKFRIRIQERVITTQIYAEIQPPILVSDFEKLFYSLKRYGRKEIDFKITFRKAGYGKQAYYYLRFPTTKIAISTTQHKKKQLGHNEIVKKIDRMDLDDRKI